MEIISVPQSRETTNTDILSLRAHVRAAEDEFNLAVVLHEAWRPAAYDADFLKNLGVSLVPASAPDFFLEDTPTAVLVRQVLGAIAQFEKASLVAKLKAARDRKIAQGVKCDGRKTYAERNTALVEAAKAIKNRGGRVSLRKVAAALAEQGFTTSLGKPYSASAVQSMLDA
jgi:hypothetical protein